jgi:hypothetical protein
MVQALCVLVLLFSLTAQADFFGFGDDKKFSSRIPPLVEKLKALKMKDDPSFEDEFNKAVKNVENGVEEEKLFCSGEAGDQQGRVIPQDQKQLCFRELKKRYLEAVNVVFDQKKKYLGILHAKQIERLSEIQKQQKSEIEKNF